MLQWQPRIRFIGLMGETRVLQLYPESQGECLLDGLYLAHRLHTLGIPQQPLVYGNFVSSLDGRIALADEHWYSTTPRSLTTASDWQLFQELHAQADCIITHGAYLRALAAGRLGNILQIGDRRLQDWRVDNGLRPQPDIVIASGSLDFPLPESIHDHGQTVIIATGAAGDTDKIEIWRAGGYEVLMVGGGRTVQGGALIRELSGRAYRSIYLLAGPRILETMLRDGVLSRLYLTVGHRLIGGERFHTMVEGDVLETAGQLKLRSLYYDHASSTGVGQFFACFEPRMTRAAGR